MVKHFTESDDSLTYEDATTRGQLSVIPPVAYNASVGRAETNETPIFS